MADPFDEVRAIWRSIPKEERKSVTFDAICLAFGAALVIIGAGLFSGPPGLLLSSGILLILFARL